MKLFALYKIDPRGYFEIFDKKMQRDDKSDAQFSHQEAKFTTKNLKFKMSAKLNPVEGKTRNAILYTVKDIFGKYYFGFD